MSLRKIVLGFAAVITMVGLFPSSGRAQSCTSNADCVKGTTCQTYSIGVTIAVPPACGADAKCDASAPADPTVVTMMTCQSAPCAVDSDCGTGMVCHPETSQICSGGTTTACPANTKCDQVASTPTTCTPTTTFMCMYKWQLPCNADADCGADFLCSPSVSGSCSGSAGAAEGSGTNVSGTPSSAGGGTGSAKPVATPVGASSADAGSTTSVDGAETCTTTSTFPGYCQAKATTCNTDADCPASWTCASSSTSGGTGGGTVSNGGAGGAATAPEMVATPTVAQTKSCQSPYAFPVRGTGNSGATDSAPGTNGGGLDGGTTTTGTGVPPMTSKGASASNSGCGVVGGVPGDAGMAVGLVLLAMCFGFVFPRRRGARIGR